MSLPRAIPPGWVELQDGSYASPSAVAKGLVSSKPKQTKACEKEAELHEAILHYCRSKGWCVAHCRMDKPSTSQIGTPDFIVAMPQGKTIWVEAKTAKGKLSLEQQAWLTALRKLGHKAGVVRHIQEFVIMAEVLG